MTDAISVTFLGNIMIGRNFNRVFQEQPFYYPWGNVAKYVRSSDIAVGNLENTITFRRRASQSFRLNPEYLKTLDYLDLSYVSLANNHILDYDEEGLIETQKTLIQHGILSGGAGSNIYQARKAVFKTIKGKTFAFISASEHFPHWGADQNKSGIWKITISRMLETMKREVIETLYWARQRSDYIIFTIHWGDKIMTTCKPVYREFSQFLIKNGVNVVYGHNARHILPFEYYQGGIIIYSLGNFINDYMGEKNTNQIGMMVTLLFQKSKIILRRELLHPLRISKYRVHFITDREEHNKVLDYFYDQYRQKTDSRDLEIQFSKYR